MSAAAGNRRDQTVMPIRVSRHTNIAAGVACSIFVLLLTLVAPSVEAQCPQGWLISGKWGLKQANQEEPNAINLTTRDDIRYADGSASYGSPRVTGNVKATVVGDDVQVEVSWSNGLSGLYFGKIGADGTIRGTGYERGTPKKKVAWYSTRPMVCRQAPLPPPTPASKPPPIKAAPPAVPPSQPQQSTGAPTITARPQTVSIPDGQTSGTTTLTWDAGKDHPYAEVWVKVDDNDERKIVEQGKGSRQVNVKSGKTYLYILTDSGEQLATVTVTAE